MDVRVTNLRSNDFEREMILSLVDTGFAVVTHHGIDFGLIKEAQQAWRLFFLANQEYKSHFVNKTDSNMGYKGFRSEKAVGASVADLKEFYHWQPGRTLPTEVWAVTQSLFYQLEDVGMKILGVLDKNTNKNSNFQEACSESDNTILRTLYYPAMDFSSQPGAVRAAAHEDINFITLLVAASAPGLQVMNKRGVWFDVPHEENSIVLNVGDMLQLATNGFYKSTTHRVVNPDSSGTDRVSMPLFVHPKGSTILSDGITAKQFLDERISKIYQKA